MNKKDKILIAPCGIYCGLCPRFYEKKSCDGCRSKSHEESSASYCSIFRCCVMKKGLQTCADCNEYPCERNQRFSQSDSFVSHQCCLPNLDQIRAVGYKKWYDEQKKKQDILVHLLDNYNDGRSKSLYCQVSALVPAKLINKGIKMAQKVDSAEQKKFFKSTITDLAMENDIDLKLRKKVKE